MPHISAPYLLAVLALAGPVILTCLRAALLKGRAMAGRPFTWIGLWGLSTATVILHLSAPGGGLADLGITPPTLGTLAWGLGGGVAGFLLFPVCNLLTGGALMRSGGGDQMAALIASPFALRLMTVVTAAVTEEVLFRGVGLAALAQLGTPGAAGLAVSLAAFILAHFPGWRPAHLVYVAAAGALLTGIYVLTGDLGAAILAHFVIDGAALLLMPLAGAGWQARKS